MKLKRFFYLIVVLLLSSAALHPVNMTVTNITYADKKLHMKIKFFADDLQGTLSQFCKVPMNLIEKKIEGNSEKCLQRYASAKFETSVNSVPVKWNYKNAYLSNDVIFVEYEASFPEVSKIKSVRIKNILQFEDFPEQKNIVNVNLFGDNKVLVFDNGSGEYVKELVY
jgi:hypothetical protein